MGNLSTPIIHSQCKPFLNWHPFQAPKQAINYDAHFSASAHMNKFINHQKTVHFLVSHKKFFQRKIEDMLQHIKTKNTKPHVRIEIDLQYIYIYKQIKDNRERPCEYTNVTISRQITWYQEKRKIQRKSSFFFSSYPLMHGKYVWDITKKKKKTELTSTTSY